MTGNGTAKKKIADERDAPQCAIMRRVLERALADADHRLEHDREHGGLQPEEQRRDDAGTWPQPA